MKSNRIENRISRYNKLQQYNIRTLYLSRLKFGKNFHICRIPILFSLRNIYIYSINRFLRIQKFFLYIFPILLFL